MGKAIRSVHFTARSDENGAYTLYPLDLRANEHGDELLSGGVYDKDTANAVLGVADHAYRRGVTDVLQLLRSGKHTDIDRLQGRVKMPLVPPCDI